MGGDTDRDTLIIWIKVLQICQYLVIFLKLGKLQISHQHHFRKVFHRAFDHFCCIKIHAEIAVILKN